MLHRRQLDSPAFTYIMWAIINAVAIGLLLFAASGCESRKVTVTTPQGVELQYTRTTLGKSNTEGVSITKQGDDWIAEVQGSGSEPGDVLIEGFKTMRAIGGAGQ